MGDRPGRSVRSHGVAWALVALAGYACGRDSTSSLGSSATIPASPDGSASAGAAMSGAAGAAMSGAAGASTSGAAGASTSGAAGAAMSGAAGTAGAMNTAFGGAAGGAGTDAAGAGGATGDACPASSYKPCVEGCACCIDGICGSPTLFGCGRFALCGGVECWAADVCCRGSDNPCPTALTRSNSFACAVPDTACPVGGVGGQSAMHHPDPSYWGW